MHGTGFPRLARKSIAGARRIQRHISFSLSLSLHSQLVQYKHCIFLGTDLRCTMHDARPRRLTLRLSSIVFSRPPHLHLHHSPRHPSSPVRGC